MWMIAHLRHVLRARASWMVALCYALLLQAALAPVLRASHHPVSPGSPTSVLCLADLGGGSHDPAGDERHDADCCILAARSGIAGAALVPQAVAAPLPLPRRDTAGLSAAVAPHGAPGSIDLPTRPARAPPAQAA